MNQDENGALVSVDDLLEKELGWRGFGPAQALALLVGGLAYTSMALVLFQMTFAYIDPLAGTGPPAWRCSDANDMACAAVLSQQQRERGYITSPVAAYSGITSDGGLAEGGGRTAGSGGGADQQPLPRSFCDLDTSQYVWLDPGLSLSSEYNLVCGQKWKASLLETLFFAGFMTGNGVFGAVADRHGRRMTLAICAAATGLLTALSASPLVPLGPGARAAAAAVAAAAAAGADANSDGADGGGSGGGGYWLHLFLRCAAGVACAGQALGAYVLATEMVGPAWRGAAGMLTQTFFILGEFLLVGLSLAFPPWRALTEAVAVACGLVLLLVPLVPESPRWLLLHGRPAKARSALLWVARLNRRPPPAMKCTAGGEIYMLLQLQPPNDHSNGHGGDPESAGPFAEAAATTTVATFNLNGDDANESETAPLVRADAVANDNNGINGIINGINGAPPSVSLWTALAHPVSRRLLLSACFVMFSLSVAYFGVTLALGSLVAGSLHLNFMLTAAAELPGYLAIAATTDKLGRRVVIGGGTALAGAACLACAFTSAGTLQVLLAMTGKLGCSGAWAIGLTFAAELFPTALRSTALSLASQSGDMGGLVTPVLLLLSPPGRWERLPFAVMGIMSLAAVALVWQLPETRGMPQLDTFEELLDWLRLQRGRAGSQLAVVTAPSEPRCGGAGVGLSRCGSGAEGGARAWQTIGAPAGPGSSTGASDSLPLLLHRHADPAAAAYEGLVVPEAPAPFHVALFRRAGSSGSSTGPRPLGKGSLELAEAPFGTGSPWRGAAEGSERTRLEGGRVPSE